MLEIGRKPSNGSLIDIGFSTGRAFWNLPSVELEEMAIQKGQAIRTTSGAIAVNTGEFTGRSPKDKFTVKDQLTESTVWWNNFNIPFDPQKFEALKQKMIDYLNGKEFFVRDAFVCADSRYRMSVRVINEYAWSNLFVSNMFINPDEKELDTFSPEWLVINAPGFHADPKTDGTRQHNFSIIDFTRKVILIGGSAYTGEIKKGVFTVLNFVLPHYRQVFPMHCSANIGEDGDTAVFFGLSGTGKTTLSTDPGRKLIGDDEHGWTPDNIIFNFEGGCYAKTIDLSVEKEPDIFNAIKEGALLENVGFRAGTQEVDFSDSTITENTRVSYPLEHIRNIARPSLGRNPKHIFFLTCDAYGVLPPIARLNPGQAAFHFISGYTAKVAGTETGITEPTMTFSACFGAPFMPLHPTVYAEMLSAKMKDSDVKVWLVNTGWTGGPYGEGSRIKLKYTRALINAALSGELCDVEYDYHDVFGVAYPLYSSTVPGTVLNPRVSWKNQDDYDRKAAFLAEAFLKNFEKYADFANEETTAGAPRVRTHA